jgi:four helix bundle protein
MDSKELKERTKKFAIDVVKLVETFPKTNAGFVIGRQLIKSATSVGANYRSACRAKSKKDFISKISIVEEESDESLYWLEIALDLQLGDINKIKMLLDEANQLTAIFTSSKITASRANKNER